MVTASFFATLSVLMLTSPIAYALKDSPDTVPLGLGSYTTKLPAGAKEPGILPFVTSAVKRPVPTNDWWSSLAFLPFSNQMFPHPLGIQAHENGLRLYYPGTGYTANPEGIFTAIMREPNDLIIGHSEQARFPDARVQSWSDWFVTAAFGNKLSLSFGHGSPFVYGTLPEGSPTFSFGSAPTVFSGDAKSPVLGVSVQGRSYGLFGPSGCRWEGLGTSKLVCQTSGKPYFSVALLPDSKPETLALFARYAHNHVTDSRVTWSYDEKQSTVTTHYAFTVKAYEGTTPGTLYGLLPHQYQRSKEPLTGHTYLCARGVIKLAEGSGFTTVTPFHGVLPLLPDLGTYDRATLKRYLDTDASAYKPELVDTYWTGKALGKLATLAALADVTGNTAANKAFRTRLKALLEDYFTATSGKTKGLFYYNKPWGTLIGYPASYGSDESLNDHHFHYGYFIRAAAELARQEPTWAKTQSWGAMVRLLIRDCANPERDDPLFPFLRNFDLYEGHTWADGKGDFADGNNNESSSEAMNAWTGMILWGELTGDKKTRDTGIFLYVTEKDAIDSYWFDVDKRYPKAFTRSLASMVWGAKAVFATWFSGDPIHMHGINLLPIQSGSLYLGTHPAYISENLASLAVERIAHDKKDPKFDPSKPPRTGKNWGGWGDVILMYQALADPAQALASSDFETQEIEQGSSRANFYHWVHFLNKAGQVDTSVSANTPLYAVLKKGNQRTYLVYSPTAQPRTVTFSDGTVLVTRKAGLSIK
jgi:endoglucanase Acf2